MLKTPIRKWHGENFQALVLPKKVPENDFGKKFHACDYAVPAEEIPVFKSVDFPFTNKFNGEKSLPLMASALIDINNDGIDEVFVGGGLGQQDGLFSYKDGAFTTASFDLPAKPENSSTYGAVSFRFGQ